MKKFIYAVMAIATLFTIASCEREELIDIDTEGYIGSSVVTGGMPYTQESAIVKISYPEAGKITVNMYDVMLNEYMQTQAVITIADVEETESGSGVYESESVATGVAFVPELTDVKITISGKTLEVIYSCAVAGTSYTVTYKGVERE